MSNQSNFNLRFEGMRQKYNYFIDYCYSPGQGYRLTPNSEVSPYALCFAIFGKHLISQMHSLFSEYELLDELLRFNIDAYKKMCIKNGKNIQKDKGYLQLLCFTLSALKIIGTLKDNSLERHVLPLIKEKNISLILQNSDIYKGKAGTGNLAMFYAIFLIYSKNYLNKEVDCYIDTWINTHLNSMNSNGFWGPSEKNLYLQFQNGYHQYEIFEYLGINIKGQNNRRSLIHSLSDKLGHFAPYPGGGGCYDYDATFLLTFLGDVVNSESDALLKKTMKSILSEQNKDGGFSESRFVRPQNFKNLRIMANHFLEKRGRVRLERARFCLTLLRPKHNKIKTHWTHYSRDWNESNLWDSWFRMLTIARIDQYLSSNETGWGFIDFPGIGYSHELIKTN